MSEPRDLPEYLLDLEPSAFTVIRLDGRGFTRRTAAYDRPFDPRFHEAMRVATEDLLDETPALFAHTASDEVSLVFRPGEDWFGYRAPKWLSVCAGVASSSLTRAMTLLDGPVSVDAKAFRAATEAEVLEYLDDRARSSYRNMVNGRCHYALLAEGLSAGAAQRANAAMSPVERAAFVPPDAPGWERVGAILGYTQVDHVGIDPRSGARVPTVRRVATWFEPLDFGGVRDVAATLLADRDR